MKAADYSGELAFFSSIAGAVASIVKSLIYHIFIWIGLSNTFYDMLNAFFTHGHHTTESFIEWLFSAMSDIAIGAFFGIFLGFWLKHSRSKYHWWIGIGYGFGIWFLTLAFGNLTKIIRSDMTDPGSLFTHLIAMLSYATLFVLATKIWKPLLKRINFVVLKKL